MDKTPPFSVRAKPETHALFNHIVRELNDQLPHGRISKTAVFDMVVSSASAALAAGKLHGQHRKDEDKT